MTRSAIGSSCGRRLCTQAPPVVWSLLLCCCLTMPNAPVERLYPSLPAPIFGTPAPSPYSFEFSGADGLRLTVYNAKAGVRVNVHYRVSRPGDPSHASAEAFAPTADRTANTWEFKIGDGYLLNVAMFASSGSPGRGQTFAKLQVIRGNGAAAIVLGTIAQGYLTGTRDLAWPGSALESSLDGDGFTRFITGTDPVAGQEWSETVPTGARWVPFSVSANLVTSAAVATRRPGIYFDNGTTTFFRSPQAQTIPASSAIRSYWTYEAMYTAAILADAPIALLPSGMALLAGYRIASATNGLQAGDNYDAPIIGVREWLEI